MQKHLPNINPTITVVGQDGHTTIGQRKLYVVNRLGDEVREPAADGSVIVKRPVVSKTLLDFEVINDEALLTVVVDRLADRAAGEFGTRRIDSALKAAARALELVRTDSTKPLRKRQVGAADDGDEGEPAPVPAPAIPGVTF